MKSGIVAAVAGSVVFFSILTSIIKPNLVQAHAQTVASELNAFEVATIRPHKPDPPGRLIVGGSCRGVDSVYPGSEGVPPLGRCVFNRVTLSFLISFAHAPEVEIGGPIRITGAPSWAESDSWDVKGKASGDPPNVTRVQLKQMLRALLADEFKLQIHHETREIQGFALFVSKGGLTITKASGDESPSMHASGRNVAFQNYPLSGFARFLSGPLRAPVLDKTGVNGGYTFAFVLPPRDGETAPTDNVGSSITAVHDLGLQLESQRIPIDDVVIDHAEKPAPK